MHEINSSRKTTLHRIGFLPKIGLKETKNAIEEYILIVLSGFCVISIEQTLELNLYAIHDNDESNEMLSDTTALLGRSVVNSLFCL